METVCNEGALFFSGVLFAGVVLGVVIKVLKDKYTLTKIAKSGGGGGGSKGDGPNMEIK